MSEIYLGRFKCISYFFLYHMVLDGIAISAAVTLQRTYVPHMFNHPADHITTY